MVLYVGEDDSVRNADSKWERGRESARIGVCSMADFENLRFTMYCPLSGQTHQVSSSLHLVVRMKNIVSVTLFIKGFFMLCVHLSKSKI